MSDRSTNLGLPYMAAAQAQKHVTHNEALELLDSITQLTVIEFDAVTPPLTPGEGEAWAIGVGGVNEWAGHDSEIAVWANGGWLFISPKTGWRAALGGDLRVFDGATWSPPVLPDLQNLPGVGIGASYDATNVLSVSGDASLLSHDGTDHRIKINKAGGVDTASMLFQSNWSGHAEFGLIGNNDFTLKVSLDGATWHDGLIVSNADGAVVFPAPARLASGTAALPALGFSSDMDTGVFRPAADTVAVSTGGAERARFSNTGFDAQNLTRGGSQVFSRDNIVGTVAQSASLPTGAVVERGSNANGSYVRFADGTQFAWKIISGLGPISSPSGGMFFSAGSSTGIRPASFVGDPEICIHSRGTGALGAWVSQSAAEYFFLARHSSSAATDYAAGVMYFGRWF